MCQVSNFSIYLGVAIGIMYGAGAFQIVATVG